MDAIHHLVWVADREGRVGYVNKQCVETTGREREELMDAGWMTLIHPDDVDGTRAAWRSALEAGSPYEYKHRVRLGNGRYHWFLSRAHPERKRNRISRWVGTATDVDDLVEREDRFHARTQNDRAQVERQFAAILQDLTERNRLEAALRESEQRKHAQQNLIESRKQNRESVSVLAGGVAHDFNNLLLAIIGNASLALEMLPANDPAEELLQRLISAGNRAASLTQQLLAYSGEVRFVFRRVDLGEIVREAARRASPLIPAPIQLDLSLPSDLPTVNADRFQLEQVIVQLVANSAEALEALEASVGTITVAAGVQELNAAELIGFEGADLHPGVHAFLEVRDTGPGMDVATQARVFDPFFTTKFAGRGLGLAAVSGIVRSHQGGIQVRSTPGQGSCFKILLPMTDGETALHTRERAG